MVRLHLDEAYLFMGNKILFMSNKEMSNKERTTNIKKYQKKNFMYLINVNNVKAHNSFVCVSHLITFFYE